MAPIKRCASLGRLINIPPFGVHMDFKYPELAESIRESVRRASEGRRVGVAFSGGLDSGLISCLANEYAESVTLYTCGSDGSFDVRAGEELSQRIGLPWKQLRISKDTLEDEIRRFISITGTDDPFTISYDLQLFTVCEYSEEDVILSGQGADEYFMGCAKLVECADCDYNAYVKDGVKRLMEVSVPCERCIASHFGKDLRYPYLDPAVLEQVALVDPADLKPRDMASRKQVLKDAACHLGYPYLEKRIKKASQYGSGTTDIIRALAKSKGMMFNRYIQSVYDEVFPDGKDVS